MIHCIFLCIMEPSLRVVMVLLAVTMLDSESCLKFAQGGSGLSISLVGNCTPARYHCGCSLARVGKRLV